MRRRPTDQSVFNEPHMRPPPPPPPDGQIAYAQPDTPDVREIDVNQDVRFEPTYSAPAPAPAVEHSVWDEPTVPRDLAGAAALDPAQVTYGRWLDQGRARWGWAKSWGLTLLIALAAGPWAVAGALLNSGQSFFGALMLIFFGPVTEELMKIAGVVLVIEKWPYVLRSSAQILLCSVAGGFAFAAIENLLYLYVYIDNPTPNIILWRWTVCVALHTVCSLVAGFGAVRVWRHVQRERRPPRLALAFPFLLAAAVTHGLYNATAYALELTGAMKW